MAKKKAEIVVHKEIQEVESFISQAIKEKASPETMERFFDLRVKVKAEIAKEQFNSALANFQRVCPVIKKTKKVMNKDGKTVRYMFAPLDSISAQIAEPISANNFSYGWDTKHLVDRMEVTCELTHVLGHSKTSTMEIPIDKDGFMTSPQKVASAVTFAKRNTLLNVTGITTADQDDDANTVGKEPTALLPKAKIIFLLKSINEKVDTKEEIQKAVEKHAKLDLEEKNFPDIIERLEAIVEENYGN